MKRPRVYFVTNTLRSSIYIGVTSNLQQRLQQHYDDRGNPEHFASKHHCYNLLRYEDFPTMKEAILREKQLKKWSRKKKLSLIKIDNPRLEFLQVPFDV